MVATHDSARRVSYSCLHQEVWPGCILRKQACSRLTAMLMPWPVCPKFVMLDFFYFLPIGGRFARSDGFSLPH
eukprot:scaffold92800_cov19-Tisochrysis_lutea.AAC.4